MTARARRQLGGWVAAMLVSATVVALGCRDQSPPTTGGIAVRFVTPAPSLATASPALGGAGPSFGATAAQFTSVRVTLAGPTAGQHNLTQNGANWTVTIENLEPGSYTVTAEGFEGSDLTYFGETGNVSVVAGATRTANVAFNPARPTLNPPNSPTTAMTFPVTFTAVTGATEYTVEWGTSAGFSGAQSAVVTASPAVVSVSALGTYHVRARATIGARAGGPSAAVTADVVADRDSSGDNLPAAGSLGFGTAVTRTLGQLNIVPASDEDWFQFGACALDTLHVETYAARLSPSSSLNTRLRLYAGDGTTVLATDDDGGGGSDSRIEHVLPADGQFGIQVTGTGGTVGHYELRVTLAGGPNLAGAACAVPIDTIVVSPTAATLRALNATQTLTATAIDAGGDTITGAAVAWSSSDDAIATVDAFGVVTAVSPGVVTITASPPSGVADGADTLRQRPRNEEGKPTDEDEGRPRDRDRHPAAALPADGNATITVLQAPASINVTPPADTIRFVTGTAQLTAQVLDSLGSALAGSMVSWSVPDTNIVSVDAAGLVTARGAGDETVTAAFDTVQAGVVVSVIQTPVGLTRVTGNMQSGFTDAPLPQPLIVRAQDAAGFGIPGVLVTWAVTSGGGSLSADSTITDSTGFALTVWTLGPSTGAQSVEAYLPDIDTVPFDGTGIAGVRWVNAAGGNWSTAANWSTNVVPTINDTVLIAIPGDYTVTVDVNAAVARLTLGEGAGTTTQTLSLAAATLDVAGLLFVIQDGVLNTGANTLNVTTLRLENGGRVVVDGGNINAGFINNRGLFEVTANGASVDVTAEFRNHDTVSVLAPGALGVSTAGWSHRSGAVLTLAPGSVLDLSVNTVEFLGGLTIDAGTFIQSSSPTFSVTGGLNIAAGGTLDLTGVTLTSDTTTNAGSVSLDASTLSGPLHNVGSVLAFAGANTLSGPLTDTPAATLEVDGIGTTLTINADVVHSGSLVLDGTAGPPGAVMLDLSGFTLSNTGTINFVNVPGTILVDQLTNDGNIYATPGICCAVVAGPMINTSLLSVGVGGFTTNDLVNNGTVMLEDSATLTIAGGTLANNGPLAGTGTVSSATVTNSDNILPGGLSALTYGSLTIDGDLTLSPTSRVVFDLDGTTPGLDLDQLNVTGLVTVDGEIDVSLANTFDLTYGTSSTVINFAARSGDWSDISALDVFSEHVLRGQYTPSLYRLRVSPPIVVVTPGSDTLGVLGDTVHMTAEARDFSNNPIGSVTAFFWVSVDTTVARVGLNTGIVQAKAPGTTTIFAFAPGGTAGGAAITVEAAPVASITVMPIGPTLDFGAGDGTVLTAEVRDALNNVVPFPVSWSSGNPGVVTVSGGAVTGVGPGQTAVLAQADTARAFATLTVLQPGLPMATAWSRDSVTPANLRKAWAAGDNAVWIIGSAGTVLFWNGTTLAPIDIGASGLDLIGLAGSGPNDIYVAAWSGEVFHFNGSSWSQLPAAPLANANAIWVASPADVWFAHLGGQVTHWNGMVWQQFDAGTSNELLAIWGSSATDVFVAGRGGVISHWDGGTWATQASGTGQDILGLWGASGANVWAAASNDTLTHYDGGNWTPSQVLGGHFTGIVGLDAADIYAAGANGPTVWHFDGFTWSQVAPYGPSVGAIQHLAAATTTVVGVSQTGRVIRGLLGGYAVLDPDTVIVGGTTAPTATGFTVGGQPVDSVVFTWSSLDPGIASVDPVTGVVTGVTGGSASIVATALGGAADTAAVWVQEPTTIAVSPSSAALADQGAMTTLSAVVFDQVGNVIPGAPVSWVSYNPNVATIDGGGTVVAVSAGQTLIQSFTGTAIGHAVVTTSVQGEAPVTLFGEMVNPDFGLGQIWRVRSTGSGNEAWAFGASGALRFDGANWSNMNIPGTRAVYNGLVRGPSDVWATADGGVLYHWNGAAWDSVQTSAIGGLYAIWMSSPTDIWVGGEDDGVIEHFDGTTWSTIALPVSHVYLWDIWGTDSARVFAVGGTSGGGVYEYDGSAWSSAAAPTPSYRGLWGPGGDTVFAGRQSAPGLSVRDGGGWSDVSGSVFNSVFGVWGSAGDDIYVSGSAGVIGRFDGAVLDSVQRLPTFATVWSVGGTPDGNVYAVTSDGRIYRGVRGGTLSFTGLPDSIFPGDTLRPAISALDGMGAVVDSVSYVWSTADPTVLSALPDGFVARDTGSVSVVVTAPGGAADTALIRVGLKAASVLILGDNHQQNTHVVNNWSPVMPGITFDTLATTDQIPSLAFLSTFDVVIAFQEQSPADPIALGDTLAAYVAGGGNLIITTFRWQGNWGTNITAIEPLAAAGGSRYTVDSAPSSLMTQHPLTVGLDTIIGFFQGGATLANGATSVATWSTLGEPAIAYRVEAGGQRLVAISTFPAHAFFNPSFGDETWFRMWENAIRWASDGGNSAAPSPPAYAGGRSGPRAWPGKPARESAPTGGASGAPNPAPRP